MLTHLRVRSSHPLAQEIRTYQAVRARQIAREDGELALVTIKPPKRRNR